MATPRRYTLLEDFDLDEPLPVAPEGDYLARRQPLEMDAFDLESATPPPEVAAFAASVPQDELRAAQRESDLLRFLSRQGQGLDESARIIAGVPGRMQVDLDAADRPVQQVQQRQAEAYKLAQAEAAKRREDEAKAERARLEAKRDEQRQEDIARGDKRASDRNRTALQAAAIQGRGKEEAARIAQDNERFERETALRKEFNSRPAATKYEEARVGYADVAQAASDPSPAGDSMLIFGYMKMIDPGVSVMEGDVKRIQALGSIPDKLLAMYQQAKGGGSLSPEVRADLLKSAKTLLDNRKQFYEAEARRYRELGAASGVAPERVAPNEQPTSTGGTIRIRRKSDGKEKTLAADKAAEYLKDPNFERVQ